MTHNLYLKCTLEYNTTSCTKQELRIRQMEVCKLLRDKGLVDWSHQKFINIPNLIYND